jgi:type II secretory ATPase GspE/PulE/Tfp pilus assembly ATPase PilB-like protein
MEKPTPDEVLKEIKEKEAENLAQHRAKKLDLPYINLSTQPLNLEALAVISEKEARLAHAVVFEKEGKLLKLAILDPQNPTTLNLIETLKKTSSVEVFVVSEKSLERFFSAYSRVLPPREEITGQIKILQVAVDALKREVNKFLSLKKYVETSQEEDVSEVVSWILAGSIVLEASDIHVEPQKNTALIRLRLDGILWPLSEISSQRYEELRDRIKLLAGMKLNIVEVPQDGRFSILYPQKQAIEVRASSIPSPYGENIVLRLLNPETIQLKLEELGLRDDDLEIIGRELKKPNGLIIVTGPTGSGKTTTLYAFLRKVNAPGIKVITIEDPIEYRLSGIEQTQVDEAEGYTFAAGLPAILRQDPDVILVGEIRDYETAETTMHASLTGHLVFSTLHTNDAAGTIPRLIDLGVKPPIISPAINLAIAQRLLRRLCPKCSETTNLEGALFSRILANLEGIPERVRPKPRIKEGMKIKKANPAGCDFCSGSGYKGRIAVFELFLIEEEMEKLIQTNPSEEAVRELAKKLGMVTMMQDALTKVLDGITDIAEVERVVGPV